MTGWFAPVLAGAAAGILSGFGAGGGTLLLIYLSSFAGVEQHMAQGINLLYFLPTAALALPAHVKNGFVEKEVLWPAIVAGLLCAAAAAFLATSFHVALLRKCFGLFLLYIGATELLRGDGEPP